MENKEMNEKNKCINMNKYIIDTRIYSINEVLQEKESQYIIA